MTTYIVTFEIKDDIRRQKVKEHLKTYGFFCPIHQFAWAIRTGKKAVNIRDDINTITSSVDRVFVIRTGTEAAWKNAFGQENSEWLKKYL